MLLLYYADWYRQIYELPATDRPEQAVIEDDVQLDRWYDQWVRDQAAKASLLKAQLQNQQHRDVRSILNERRKR